MTKPFQVFARGRVGRTLPGQMNKLEAAYAEQLWALKLSEEIEWFGYELLTFTLTHSKPGVPGQRYTPDFTVMRPDGMIELHEVKGFRDEKNINKLKVAAEMFPFRFWLVTRRRKKDGGGWETKEY